MRATWDCTDARDQFTEREFLLYRPEELNEIRQDHWAALYCLAIPNGDTEAALIIDRLVTANPRDDARALLAALAGANAVLPDAQGRPDRDRARNLQNRLALYSRDATITLMLAVHLGEPVAKAARQPPKPTDAMIERVRRELGEEGMDGTRWQTAVMLDQLPAAPHPRATFALVGVDAKGRIHNSLPRPSHADLDKWEGRDLRQWIGAFLAHPHFDDTARFGDAAGLTLLFCWRYTMPQRAVA